MRMMQTEPVRVVTGAAAAVSVLVAAFVAMAIGFGWVTWTPEQTVLVMAVYTAASYVIVGAITRGKVFAPATVGEAVEQRVDFKLAEYDNDSDEENAEETDDELLEALDDHVEDLAILKAEAASIKTAEARTIDSADFQAGCASGDELQQ